MQPGQEMANVKHDEAAKDDWKQEAPLMAQYYQNAWCTITATSVAVEIGLFNIQRTQPSPRITRLPYRDKTGGVNGYFYVQHAHRRVLQDELTNDFEKSELLQRGWVFQERLLSRRNITFTESGLFLYCHTEGAKSLAGDVLSPRSGPQTFENERTINILGLHQPLATVTHGLWRQVVRLYSGLRLTRLVEDRLIALAGVASEFGRVADEVLLLQSNTIGADSAYNSSPRYACGLWLHDVLGLLWEQATPGFRYRVPGIPSWSWASMASQAEIQNNQEVLTGGMKVRWPIGNLYGCEKVLLDVRKATTFDVDEQSWQPQLDKPLLGSSEHEYGIVNRFIVLTIYGSMCPVQVQRFLNESENDLAVRLSFTGMPKLRDISGQPRGADLWRAVCIAAKPRVILGWASIEHPQLQINVANAASEQVYALFVQRNEENGGWFRTYTPMYDKVVFRVLLLRRAATAIPGMEDCFERVGVGGLWGDDIDKVYQSTAKSTISLI